MSYLPTTSSPMGHVFCGLLMELLRLLAARVSRPALGANAPKRRSQTLSMAPWPSRNSHDAPVLSSFSIRFNIQCSNAGPKCTQASGKAESDDQASINCCVDGTRGARVTTGPAV